MEHTYPQLTPFTVLENNGDTENDSRGYTE